MIRIFADSLPARLRSEALVRIVARYANCLHTFGINMNYTQYSLKCNLSTSIWTQIVKTLAYLQKGIMVSPSRSLAVIVALTEVMLLNQMHPLYLKLSNTMTLDDDDKTISNIHTKSRSGFSESFVNIGQTTKKRKSLKILNQSLNQPDELDEDIQEKESESRSHDISDSAEYSSFESSNASSSSSEEELDSLVLIDNALDPGRDEGRFKKAKRLSKERASMASHSKQTLNSPPNKIAEEESQDSISDIDEDTEQHLKSEQKISFRKSVVTGNDLRMFDLRTPIDRLKPKIERRRVLNEVRLKKVNFSEKIKITKVTNTLSIEQVITQVIKETSQEWNNFDVYADNNKYNIKDVISQYVDNFTNNLVLGITNDRGLTQLQQSFNTKYLLRNLRAGKVKSINSSSAVHQPEFGLIRTSKAKTKMKKFMSQYYDLLNQVVNAHYCQAQLMETKIQPQIKKLEAKEIETSYQRSESRSPDRKDPAHLRRQVVRASMVKFMFLGEQLDQTSVDYIQQNFAEYVGTFLHSSAALLWKKSLELGVLLDLTETMILTDCSIKAWLVSLLINLILIGRQFQILKINENFKLNEVLDSIQSSLEDALLYGRKITIILDIEDLVEASLSRVSLDDDSRLNILMNAVTQFLNGTAHYLYHSTFLHHLIMHMWQEDYIKALTYDELLEQISKTVSANINFILFASESRVQILAGYLQNRHPSLFDRTMFRLFGPVTEENYFDRTVLWRLLKYTGSSSLEGQNAASQNMHLKMVEHDMDLIHGIVMKGHFDFKSVISNAQNLSLTASVERINAIIDVGLCYKIFRENDLLSQYEYASDCLQRILAHPPDHKNLENTASLSAADIAMTFQNVNLPKILRIEEQFASLLTDGLNMNSTQINILCTAKTLLSEDFSLIPVIYDPQGFSLVYFKSMTRVIKAEHSYQYTDSVDCRVTPSTLVAKIEAGARVVLGIANMMTEDLKLVEVIVQALVRYFTGKALGYYTCKNKVPAIRVLSQKATLGNNFRFALVVRKRNDLLQVLNRFKECRLLSYIRLLAFEEHINSSMLNSKAMIKELDVGRKQRLAILNISQVICNSKATNLFNNVNELATSFNISDRIGTRAVTFTNPDETKILVNYQSILQAVQNLSMNETVKNQSISIGSSGKASIQLKLYLPGENPFDITYSEQYFSPSIKDLSSTFQKVLLFFSQIRAGQEGGIDAFYLMNTIATIYESFKQALLTKNQNKFKIDPEAACLETEHKYWQNFGAERVQRYIELECPNIWYQLELAFVIKMSFSLMPADVPLFKLWLWMNHISYENTAYSKFVYSNTFQKRFNTMNTSLSISKFISAESDLEIRDFKVMIKLQSIKKEVPSPSSNRFNFSPTAKKSSQLSLKDLFTSLGAKHLQDSIVNYNPFESRDEKIEIAAIEDTQHTPSTPSQQIRKRKHSDFIIEVSPDTLEKMPSSASSRLSRKQSTQSPAPSAYKKSKFAQASQNSAFDFKPAPRPVTQNSAGEDKEIPKNTKSNKSSKDDHTSMTEQAPAALTPGDTESQSKLVFMAKLNQIAENSELSSSMKNISMPIQKMLSRKYSDFEENSPLAAKSFKPGNLLILRPLANDNQMSDEDDPDKLIQRDIDRNRFTESGLETPKEKSDVEEDPDSPGIMSKADSIISPIRKQIGKKGLSGMSRKISFRFDTFKEKDFTSPGASPFRSPARSARGTHQESKIFLI